MVTFMKRWISICIQSFHHHLVDWTKSSNISLVLGTITDLARSKSELVAENALLRQQLIILSRQMKRPICAKTNRMLLVLLARIVRTWKQAIFIVQPEKFICWHRLKMGSSALLPLLYNCCMKVKAQTPQAACSVA
jgi:putative transposase